MSKQYTAQTPVAVLAGGRRTVIRPGDVLPELPAQELRALVAAGAAVARTPPETAVPAEPAEPTPQPRKKKGAAAD